MISGSDLRWLKKKTGKRTENVLQYRNGMVWADVTTVVEADIEEDKPIIHEPFRNKL